MTKDPLLDELHRIREEYAARFNYDLKAIYRDFKEREDRGEFVTVRRSPRRPRLHGEAKKRVAQRGAA